MERKHWVISVRVVYPFIAHCSICSLHAGTNLFCRNWRHGNRSLTSFLSKIFSKLHDEKELNFESALLGRKWSQNRGNFGGSIEFSRRISLGVKGVWMEHDEMRLTAIHSHSRCQAFCQIWQILCRRYTYSCHGKSRCNNWLCKHGSPQPKNHLLSFRFSS